MKRYCLTLDLKPDKKFIKQYDEYHARVWPEILKSITDSGILNMEIFRFSNRLCMLMETTEEFSFKHKGKMDKMNEKVQDWETLMWNFQQSVPGAKLGEKWVLMNKIFDLNQQ